MQQFQEMTEQSEKAILVGVKLDKMGKTEAEESLQELALLADTAGFDVVCETLQPREIPDAAYYIGRGKADELQELGSEMVTDVFIFDNDLSPAQTRNLEKLTDGTVIDRSALILDIFEQRARTKEAKIQVELAQLQYALPRLTRQWTHLSRLGGGPGRGNLGGVGTRGMGETQLQVDRRLIRTKISRLKRELKEVERHRRIQRANRRDMMSAAIVGYTNAGKSTLLNAMTDENVFVEDKLFATLDPTTRIAPLPENHKILLTDTVGFIKKLPHHLVASFKATLEEVTEADLLLHVVDASHPRAMEQIKIVQQVLAELDASEKPTIMLLNKVDKVKSLENIHPIKNEYADVILISALTGEGLDELKAKLVEIFSKDEVQLSLAFSHRDGKAINYLHEHGEVLEQNYEGNSVKIEAKINKQFLERLRKLAPTAFESK